MKVALIDPQGWLSLYPKAWWDRNPFDSPRGLNRKVRCRVVFNEKRGWLYQPALNRYRSKGGGHEGKQ